MDIRVGCSVIFGLSDTFEGFLQEGGRSMRGGEVETQGQTGFSFFLRKGALVKERVWKNRMNQGSTHTLLVPLKYNKSAQILFYVFIHY